MKPQKPTREEGFALVAVLWGVALLSLIAGSILTSGFVSRNLARETIDHARWSALAEAGINRGILGLVDPRLEQRWRIDGTPYDFAFEGAHLVVSIQDELGKIDLNASDGTLLVSLFKSVGLDAEMAAALVDKILDWRDASAARRLHGAKAEDYQGAGYAYVPRGGPFQTVDELKLVMGMTPALFVQVEPALTVYSQRPTFDPQTAPRTALLAIQGIDNGKVDVDVALRSSAAGSMVGGGASFAEDLTLAGRAFTIEVDIGNGSGRLYSRRTVIRLTGDPLQPVLTLASREGL